MFFNQKKLSHHFCKPNNIHILTYWVVLSQIITPPPPNTIKAMCITVYVIKSFKESRDQFHRIKFSILFLEYYYIALAGYMCIHVYRSSWAIFSPKASENIQSKNHFLEYFILTSYMYWIRKKMSKLHKDKLWINT